VLVSFALIQPRHRAVIAAFLVAWLFLPMTGYSIPGLPDYTKMSATSYGLVLGILLFDSGRLTQFRPRWFDLPMVMWCLVPFASSISNGLGAYDGVSASVGHVVTWGMPYFIGRVYFTTPAAMRELAIGLVIGGLLYVPLCLYEVRMSPQLHTMFYGFHQHSFAQTKRFGGWRPVVFMQHGLMVAMWMCMTALIAWALWYRGKIKGVRHVPMSWLAAGLIVTAVLCKSVGALVLMLGGMGVFWLIRSRRRAWPLLLVMAVVPAYIGVRAPGLWSGRDLVAAAGMIGERQAGSLRFRMENEDILAEKAMQRPLVGWGGWGRNRVHDEETGRDISVTDGLWIIALGQHGVIGVSGLFGSLLLPGALLVRRICGPQGRTLPPESAVPPLILATVVTLYAIDCLPNGMINPIFTLTSGALGGLLAAGAINPMRISIPASRRRRNPAPASTASPPGPAARPAPPRVSSHPR